MSKDKILVEIKGPGGVRKKKCVIEGKNVIIKKGKGVRGDPSIKAEFNEDCILHYSVGIGFARRWKRKLFWIEGHEKCVSYKGKVDLSYMDVKGYFEAGAIKNSGSTLQTVKIPTILYVLFGGMLILQVIILIMSSGRVTIS